MQPSRRRLVSDKFNFKMHCKYNYTARHHCLNVIAGTAIRRQARPLEADHRSIEMFKCGHCDLTGRWKTKFGKHNHKKHKKKKSRKLQHRQPTGCPIHRMTRHNKENHGKPVEFNSHCPPQCELLLLRQEISQETESQLPHADPHGRLAAQVHDLWDHDHLH